MAEPVVGWTAADVPPQYGRVAVITGSTSGLGLEAALALARADAHVVIAARDAVKAGQVIGRIWREHPGARVDFQRLDTSDLGSVHDFADRWHQRRLGIDVLLLNAGISNVPTREVTPDGFELQFATNYLGHFALAGRLFPHLNAAPGTRVVWVSSLQSRRAQLHCDDLQLAEHYSPMGAYGQSKLAMLTAALELDRRLHAAGSPIASLAAHPGVATTGIVRGGGRASALRRHLATRVFGLVGQPAARGALPVLFAATAPEARGGGFYGPDGRGERRGAPAPATICAAAEDPGQASRLWSASEQLCGVSYRF